MTNEFRVALNLLDSGNVDGLRDHLRKYPELVHERSNCDGPSYFHDPTLLQFVAENPIRRGTLPGNIVDVATVILEAGAKFDQPTLDKALMLVCSGRVARESQVQIPLIELLCGYGARPDSAVTPALVHGEFEAIQTLLLLGAHMELPLAAGLDRVEDVRQQLAEATNLDRQRALAAAAQFGHADIVEVLLDAGADPNRYNPDGFHSHSTPLHQAVAGGHQSVVQLLVERGADLTCQDTMWNGTPTGWAQHEGRTEIEAFLRAREDR